MQDLTIISNGETPRHVVHSDLLADFALDQAVIESEYSEATL